MWAIAAGMTALVLAVGCVPADHSVMVGTTGFDAGVPADSPATLHDLETVTGTVDPYELVGQPVDFHLYVARTDEGNSFWVGTGDNRLLVIPEASNQQLTLGQRVRITGTIEGLRPAANEQKVYIRADSVTPES